MKTFVVTLLGLLVIGLSGCSAFGERWARDTQSTARSSSQQGLWPSSPNESGPSY